MTVTTYFVDDEWGIYKKLIDFRPIKKGEDIALELLGCIHGYKLRTLLAYDG